MSVRPLATLKHTLAALLLVQAAAASAADPVTQALQSAYAPYRAALFKTSAGNQAEAAQAMAQATQAWQQLISQHGRQPGAPYDRDAGFASALDEVNRIYAQASEQIAHGELGPAHGTLEAVREITAELRQRNQIITFSDHMNAYHAQMEHLLEHADQALHGGDRTAAMLDLAGQVGALDYLARRLGSQAPAELRGQAEFGPLLQDLQSSVTALQTAVRAQDAAAVQAALGHLKKPYSKMFLKFG